MSQPGQHELRAPIETLTLRGLLHKAGVDVRSGPLDTVDGIITSGTKLRIAAVRGEIKPATERSVLAQMAATIALPGQDLEAGRSPRFWLRGEVSLDDLAVVKVRSVWAAHLLVKPYAQAYDPNIETLDEFSQSIGVPTSVVRLYLATQDRTFEVEPSDWMERMLNSDDANVAAS